MESKSKSSWAVVQKTYKIKEKLGEGTFGSVYKAKHIETKKTVAIKKIAKINRDNYSLRQVIRELVILRKLSSIEDNMFTTNQELD